MRCSAQEARAFGHDPHFRFPMDMFLSPLASVEQTPSVIGEYLPHGPVIDGREWLRIPLKRNRRVFVSNQHGS